MRVLFITGEFPPMQGGVGDCTNEIAKGLDALGVQVGVLTSLAGSDGQKEKGDKPFPVLPIVTKWNWSSLRVIGNAVREFAPDVVHIQYQTGAYGMHPAINFLPRWLDLSSHLLRPLSPPLLGEGRGGWGSRVRWVRPVVTTFHDLRVPYLFPKAGPVRQWVTRVLAQSCDAAIATNDEDYRQLETWNLKFLTVIPIGSNIRTDEPAHYDRTAWRARLGIASEETLLCYFGFLNESKGGETLVRALALVPRVKLLMIGGQVGASDPTDAAYLAKVKALIAELRLIDRVLWTDYTPPEIVTANFRAADICVLPYRDGASYRRGTLMAALAHAMPIVTTYPLTASSLSRQKRGEKGGVRVRFPALRDGENCLLVSRDDPRALADAVQRGAAAPELRAKLGAGARALAGYFTWDKIARQHLDLYKQMTQEK